jgi:hypothetical protein
MNGKLIKYRPTSQEASELRLWGIYGGISLGSNSRGLSIKNRQNGRKNILHVNKVTQL